MTAGSYSDSREVSGTCPLIALARASYVMLPEVSVTARARTRIFSRSTSLTGIAETIGPTLLRRRPLQWSCPALDAGHCLGPNSNVEVAEFHDPAIPYFLDARTRQSLNLSAAGDRLRSRRWAITNAPGAVISGTFRTRSARRLKSIPRRPRTVPI